MNRAYSSGIYEIVNRVNGKRYIGSAVNLRNRWNEHRRTLRKSEHHSVALQRAWAQYGSGAFEFRVLVFCCASDLIDYEQRFLDAVDPEYNICRVAGSSAGIKHTAETRAKMSAAQRGNTNTLGHKYSPEACARMGAGKVGKKRPPFSDAHRANISAAKKGNQSSLGRRLSDATKAKIAAAITGQRKSLDTLLKCADLSPEQVREIRRLRASGLKTREVAEQFGIKHQRVSKICLGKIYQWVSA